VRAKDTPNFIANRVGIFGMLATIKEAEKYGIRYDVVDDLTGSKLGRAKSATFRTADVVGLDTMAHVIRTMQETPAAVDRPLRRHFATPPVLKALVEKGALGRRPRPASIARTASSSRCSTRRSRTTSSRPARPTSWSRAS